MLVAAAAVLAGCHTVGVVAPDATDPCLVLPRGRTPSDKPDFARTRTYVAEEWEYVYEVTDPGTLEEGQWGRLRYEGGELDPPEINDRLLTPWGLFYYFGVPQCVWGPHGWMPYRNDRFQRNGRLLAPPDNVTKAHPARCAEARNGIRLCVAAAPQGPPAGVAWFELSAENVGVGPRTWLWNWRFWPSVEMTMAWADEQGAQTPVPMATVLTSDLIDERLAVGESSAVLMGVPCPPAPSAYRLLVSYRSTEETVTSWIGMPPHPHREYEDVWTGTVQSGSVWIAFANGNGPLEE